MPQGLLGVNPSDFSMCENADKEENPDPLSLGFFLGLRSVERVSGSGSVWYTRRVRRDSVANTSLFL